MFELTIPGIDSFDATMMILLAVVLLLAGFVHGLLGLGFPMIATPLIALMTDVRSAILVLLLPTMAVNVVNIIKGGHWRAGIAEYWPLAAYGALGSIAGSRFLITVDPAPFQLVLAGVILLYLYKYQIGINLQWLSRRPQLAFMVYGLAGGFLAGTVNVMVPLLIIFALERGLAPKTMVQVFNFCFFFGKLAQTIVFTQAGLMDGSIVKMSFLIAAISLGALFGGIALRDKVDTETYRRWLRVVLWIITAVLISKYVYGMVN